MSTTRDRDIENRISYLEKRILTHEPKEAASVAEAWKNDLLGDYFELEGLKEKAKIEAQKKVTHVAPGYELFQATYEYLRCQCSNSDHVTTTRTCRVCERVQGLISELEYEGLLK